MPVVNIKMVARDPANPTVAAITLTATISTSLPLTNFLFQATYAKDRCTYRQEDVSVRVSVCSGAGKGHITIYARCPLSSVSPPGAYLMMKPKQKYGVHPPDKFITLALVLRTRNVLGYLACD